MNADDLRLTADQIVKITGCSPNVLKDITRTRGTKPPFLRPDFEANGQGHKDYYSWNNAMCVALFLELRKAGVERKIIIPSLWAAKKMDYKFKDLPPHYKTMIGHDGIGSNPFKELEIKKHPIEICELFGMDKKKEYSLIGGMGSEFWMDEWEYPRIGVYFASCPSGGHDLVCLDYRQCGVDGEPQVVHIDQEMDFKTVLLANNFEEFVRGLITCDI